MLGVVDPEGREEEVEREGGHQQQGQEQGGEDTRGECVPTNQQRRHYVTLTAVHQYSTGGGSREGGTWT